MSAREIIALLFLGATFAGGAFMAGCSKGPENGGGAQAAKKLYTCGMHPQVIQDHPGDCPICGMKLTPVREAAGATNASSDQSAQPGERKSQTIAIDSVTIQNMGIRTAIVTRGPLRRNLRAVGMIDYNETTSVGVTAKFKGSIEKLYVNAVGQPVMRGDPLFDMESPKLCRAQTDYLLATSPPANARPDAQAIQTRARARLKSFDISDEQIAELEQTRQPRKTLRVLAPQDGLVIEMNVVEGQIVRAGTKLCRLADLGMVWIHADIYEQDLVYLQPGQEATVTLSHLPDREFRGRVACISPKVDGKTHSARVRMEFQNPGGFLKPGMAASLNLVCELEPSALLIPDMAILRSGETTTVFVALDGGKFEPRRVTLGPGAEQDEYQVLSGVSEGERIVTSGQFMLDSESQLREALQKMMPPRQAAGRAERETAGVSSIHGAINAAPSVTPAAVKYICPLPEHVSIQYDQPGKCPLCGTTLAPVSQATLKRLQPGGEIIYYTCPMPEHNEARFDKPGPCPKCGLTLIPVMEAPPLSGSDGARGHTAMP
jgi:RND family efflux transporter MFP subunit